MILTIRDARAGDEAAWRQLWDGYSHFYGAAIPDAITQYTWQRALDPAMPVIIRLAHTENAIVGFSLSILHEGSWVATPICYLEDLFVDPAYRGKGAGKALIQDLIDMGKARGWSRLYWHTRTENPARKLYDGFTPADDYVRYRMTL